MPHINLLFPFVGDADFPAVATKFSEVLKTINPFEVTFDSFKYFQHGSCVMYLNPTPESEIKNLQSLLQQCVPFCNELQLKSDTGFTPHLTVGQWSSREVLKVQKSLTDSTISQLQPFMAKSIDLISREGDTPFKVRYTVCLGTGEIVKNELLQAYQPKEISDDNNNFSIYCGKLPASMDSEALGKAFSQLGLNVVSSVVKRQPSGQSKGFGFVTFGSSEHFQTALKSKMSFTVKPSNK